jgi:hypothetical protein
MSYWTEPNWIRKTLNKYRFTSHRSYMMKRKGDNFSDTAHIGEVGTDRWAVTLFIQNEDCGNFYKEEQLEDFLKQIDREKKLKRIIKK